MKEIWKDIPGYEGIYQVSNYGKVKRLARQIKNIRGVVSNYKEKLLTAHWIGGYDRYTLTINYKSKAIFAHRLVAMAFIPNPENKPVVNHIDGNIENNFYKNLEWCTISENCKHAFDIGLHVKKKGEKSEKAKLTNKQVIKIRNLYSTGNYSQRKLAKKYNVHQKTIFRIVHNEVYKKEFIGE